MDTYNTGNIVKTRGRDWIVQPSRSDTLIILKPLDGGEDESIAIYRELLFEKNSVEKSQFELINNNDLGTFSKGKLLYNATRLSFRDSSAPFRSIAKLSFRPRAYQMVPLIMALRQYNNESVRLLIADDVGVGKTIEALLILKEMLERKQIERFSVIALPHLCEQWQEELKSKFNIDAVIVKSNTMAKLDREIYGDTPVYKHYPYQIISIDLIKSETRRNEFLEHAPEFIIVDEAHTASATTQQQRNNLIKKLSKDKNRHLLLLTATPHSGKEEQFKSLLGLLSENFINLDLINNPRDRKLLSKFYVQRRRADVEKWMNEDTPFPKRETYEINYKLSLAYGVFYKKLVEFTLSITNIDNEGHSGKKRFRAWTALALLRGVISSPDAGIEMLKNRASNYKSKYIKEPNNYNGQNSSKGQYNSKGLQPLVEEQPLVLEDSLFYKNPVIEDDYSVIDYEPIEIIKEVDWKTREKKELKELEELLSELKGKKYDFKLKETIKILKDWKTEGYNPVVFCRYINSAKYIGEYLKKEKEFKNVDIEIITSELPNELRKEKIANMSTNKQRILIATDCLSEGINLQEKFNAVLHYDLPWNPNRLEQREGRVDRFGQRSKLVKTLILYSEDNPIDKTVMKVLVRKIKEIRKTIGITIPFAENNQKLLDSLFEAVVKNSKSYNKTLPFEDYQEASTISSEFDKAANREKTTRSIFAQNAIKAEDIEQDLKDVDNAIGSPSDVEDFTINSLRELGGQIDKDGDEGYLLFLDKVPKELRYYLLKSKENTLKITFYSPPKEDYYYLGRNHPFIENLSHKILNDFIITKEFKGRASVITTKEVEIKTTLLLFRVRNVIKDIKKKENFLSEEAIIMGFEGSDINRRIKEKRVMELFENIKSDKETNEFKKLKILEKIFDIIKDKSFSDIAKNRNQKLVNIYQRFYNVLEKNSSKNKDYYEVVRPIMPMELIAVYVLLPL